MNSSITTITSVLSGLALCTALSVQSDGPAPKPPASATAPAEAAPSDDPSASFFDALQRHPGHRDEAIRQLTEVALNGKATPKEVLHLGLAHLWAAAEGLPSSPDSHQHAVLATHWLERAEALRPDDDRVPGWRLTAAWSVAKLEGRVEDAAAAIEGLLAQTEIDPCFNSVTLGIAAFDLPRESPSFQRALKAMNAGFDCGNEQGGQDRPRWPHNVAGFLTALCDFRLKAGDVAGAETALVIAEARESHERWPHRQLVADRFASLKDRAARFANGDPNDDPAFALQRGGALCTVCHAASNAR